MLVIPTCTNTVVKTKRHPQIHKHVNVNRSQLGDSPLMFQQKVHFTSQRWSRKCTRSRIAFRSCALSIISIRDRQYAAHERKCSPRAYLHEHPVITLATLSWLLSQCSGWRKLANNLVHRGSCPLGRTSPQYTVRTSVHVVINITPWGRAVFKAYTLRQMSSAES